MVLSGGVEKTVVLEEPSSGSPRSGFLIPSISPSRSNFGTPSPNPLFSEPANRPANAFDPFENTEALRPADRNRSFREDGTGNLTRPAGGSSNPVVVPAESEGGLLLPLLLLLGLFALTQSGKKKRSSGTKKTTAKKRKRTRRKAKKTA